MRQGIMAIALAASGWLGLVGLASSDTQGAPTGDDMVALADGPYRITLSETGGTTYDVARLSVKNGNFSVVWHEDLFKDAFLSMRPFRCLEGAERTLCRVPYPYENRRQIESGSGAESGVDSGAGAYTDLEYDLLFVWKRKGEYGINFWNGMYYRLQPDGVGENGSLIGVLHEVDMDVLAVPPAAGDLRPIGPGQLSPAEPDSHWLPFMMISPQQP